MADDEIFLLSRGLTGHKLKLTSRRLRLKEHFYNEGKTQELTPNPFRLKSTWCLPSDRDLILNIYIDTLETDIMSAKPTRIRISARLLKDSASVISGSLTRLFNQSLESCTFPSLWKFGKVSALFKKGDRCDANNYRPITVLPTVNKILEKAVRIQLYAFLTDNGIITCKQFGFRPKLSTGTALAHFTDNILQNMDAGRFTGAVFSGPIQGLRHGGSSTVTAEADEHWPFHLHHPVV